MGIWDRITRRRTEEQKRLWDYSTDLTAPPTYFSDLISGEIWDRDNPKHQRDVAYKDAVANYITVKIAENTFDDWFVLVDKNGIEHPDNQRIQRELKRMNAKKKLTQTLVGERIFGDTVLYTGPNVYREDYDEGYQLANLDVFTPIYFDLPKDMRDDKGRPEIVRIYPNPANRAIYEDLPYNDFIHFITRPRGRSYRGYAATYSAWVDLTYIRISKHAQSWLDGKHGLGIFAWFLEGRLTDETEGALEDMLEDLSVMRAAIVDGNLVKDVKWIGPPASGASRINDSIDMLLGLVSAATGVPKDILIGLSAGAITGSEINNKALYATLNQIQMSMEPYIRELIKRMGYENDYEIDWNTRYATDELEQAQIRLLNAQSAQMETLTAQGRTEGDIMISLKTGKEEQQTRNKEGLQA